jgi:hypothetical protein
MFDPTNLSFLQRLARFFNTILLVTVLLGITLFLQDFELLLLIDGAVLSNILMLLLPNALYLYQVNYGYLKYQES